MVAYIDKSQLSDGTRRSGLGQELYAAVQVFAGIRFPELSAVDAQVARLPTVGASLRAEFDAHAQSELLRLLESRDPNEREAAAGMARGLGIKGMTILVSSLSSVDTSVCRTALGAIIRTLREDTSGEVGSAVRPALEAALTGVTAGNHVGNRLLATEALGLLTGLMRIDLNRVLETLDGDDAEASVHAAELLLANDCFRPVVVRALTNIMRQTKSFDAAMDWSRELDARRQAARVATGLKSFFPDELAAAFIAALDSDPCLELRQEIIKNAGHYAEGAVPILRKALLLREQGITDVALAVVGKLGPQALPLKSLVVELAFSHSQFANAAWSVFGHMKTWDKGL